MPQTKGAALKKGDTLPVSIDSVAFGGQGVGRHDDLVIFVPLTVDGDEGWIEILEVKKRYAVGKLHALTTASPFRVEARCPVYGRCGGCQYQHIRYDHQLVLKRRHVYDAFSRIGKFQHMPLDDTIPSPSPWHYRGKAEFHIRKKNARHVVIGFNRATSHDVLDIERCEIVNPTINESLILLRQALNRQGKQTNERRQIVWSSSAVASPSRDYITRHVKDIDLLVPREGFFQANLFLAETLLDTVMDMCALTGTETVVDCYCGSGFFSVFLAPRARTFHGIEFAVDAVEAAKQNMTHFGAGQAQFHAGDVGSVLRKAFVQSGKTVDVLVLDPPREGLDTIAASAAAQLNPSRMVYVSCNPATMARDIRFFTEHGYIVKRLQPVDMFPQTSHIEVVALLCRGSKGSS